MIKLTVNGKISNLMAILKRHCCGFCGLQLI